MRICVIIPVYNHHQAIGRVVEQLKYFGVFCFLINDGSSSECSNELTRIAAKENAWLMLYERQNNGGKGAAVIDGLQLAIDRGYTHAIQIDADGQHKIAELEQFIEASQRYPKRMILGQPHFDDSAPKKRLYGRVLTNVWIWINTLSFAIKDGMCGFRSYPLTEVGRLLQSVRLGQGMDFDIDIVVRLYWQGLEVLNIPTEVQYPLDGVSHFKMLHDNLRISCKHAQLFFGMLLRFPKLVMRHIK